MKMATLLLFLAAVAAAAEEPRPAQPAAEGQRPAEPAAGEAPPPPVNPRATPQARRLLEFLQQIAAKHTIAGQHNFVMSGSRFTDRVQELTGKRPLLWGSDFSFAYEGEKPHEFQHCGPLNLSEPGTKPAFTELTPEAARDRMVKNAIQAWRNDEAFAYEDFWPGHDTVDVLAADVYRDDWKPSHHDDLAKLARGKPIVIGECAPPPTPETLASQPRWAWYMPWGNLVFWGGGPERTKALLADPRVLTREDVTREEDGTWRIKR